MENNATYLHRFIHEISSTSQVCHVDSGRCSSFRRRGVRPIVVAKLCVVFLILCATRCDCRDSASLYWFSVDPMLQRLKWSDADGPMHQRLNESNNCVIDLSSITDVLPCQVPDISLGLWCMMLIAHSGFISCGARMTLNLRCGQKATPGSSEPQRPVTSRPGFRS